MVQSQGRRVRSPDFQKKANHFSLDQPLAGFRQQGFANTEALMGRIDREIYHLRFVCRPTNHNESDDSGRHRGPEFRHQNHATAIAG